MCDPRYLKCLVSSMYLSSIVARCVSAHMSCMWSSETEGLYIYFLRRLFFFCIVFWAVTFLEVEVVDGRVVVLRIRLGWVVFCYSSGCLEYPDGGGKMHSVLEALPFFRMCIAMPTFLNWALTMLMPFIGSSLELKMKAPSSTYKVCGKTIGYEMQCFVTVIAYP